jgi:uncharacterized membrane protein
MASTKKAALSTKQLTLLAVLTAITVLLQFTSVKFGIFQIALFLIPIVIGSALIGVLAGGWLGLVSAVVILLNGDSALFLAWNAPATIAVVIVKGVLSGLAAGAVYKLLEKKNKLVAVLVAALAAPIVNTGIFIAGAYAFFLDDLTNWEFALQNATATIFVLLVGVNFFVETAVNLVLSSAIVRLVQIGEKRN